jgi:hypothetical protein
MGQSQRTSRSPVITCRFRTGTEKTEVECGWQEGHQRSYEKTLGGETSRSSVAPADCGKENGGEGSDKNREEYCWQETAEKGTEGYESSRTALGSVDHSSRATACGASAPTCDLNHNFAVWQGYGLYFWFSWCPTLTQVWSPYPDKVGGETSGWKGGS